MTGAYQSEVVIYWLTDCVRFPIDSEFFLFATANRIFYIVQPYYYPNGKVGKAAGNVKLFINLHVVERLTISTLLHVVLV